MALGKMTTICGSDRVTARTRAHTRTRTHARAFLILRSLRDTASANLPMLVSHRRLTMQYQGKKILPLRFVCGGTIPPLRMWKTPTLYATLPPFPPFPQRKGCGKRGNRGKLAASEFTTTAIPTRSRRRHAFVRYKRRIKNVMRGAVKGQYPHRILIVFHIFV